ncbi:MAG: hypothetical protein RMI89_06560 [Gloeomargarita sp. SKYBB_i_bin120]|nr:hypothetical protein [Gloeomargarita sp. SKYB120]MDW8178184.1 hypothetical protein [Gloeomargarita sp. SKYBB_i_bin120]
MSNFYKRAGASHSVGTKMFKEIKSGKFIALGYGNICASELETIVISSYPERHFAPDSAIGAVAATVGQDYLISYIA